ncbi:ATP-binding protein [uncultured Roseovarius sp.]|uniref:ATP-binding protein n=1 Tax=uncultured Roseovarius sp. TaxID=293344 RepID=UPI0034203BE1
MPGLNNYRVAQEALTNIERHSGAAHVAIDVRGHLNGATLRITDNGCGLDEAQARQGGSSGLGLRNMQERIDQLDSTLRIISSTSGTGLEASAPLTHLLKPQGQPDPAPRTKAQAGPHPRSAWLSSTTIRWSPKASNPS